MNDSSAPSLSPGDQLIGHIRGFWISQIIHAIARLGVADRFASGPRTSDEVAPEVKAHAEGLYRLLRGAASVGLMQEMAPRTFALTPMGQLLRSDVPGSMREMALGLCDRSHWLPWGQLAEAIRTNHSTTRAALGTDIWEYFASHPEEGTLFAKTMGALTQRIASEVPRLHDFSGYGRVADVGGSQGVLLEAVLRAHPSCQGILFDLPPVIEGARARIESVGLANRIKLVGGSFFEPVIPAAEAYLVKHIIHDWDDAPATTILRHIHQGAPQGARLILVERVMSDEGLNSTMPLMDLNMLVMADGRERTAHEFQVLLEGTGWQFERITPAQSGMVSLIEARRG
ncbi:acetylserotonin O-methyltransferase [Hyalangium versicolor]|uniref:acetylserotonin O-methyltransferase n=1 Tax=Hyalangium versicolor TaxID=2861190 RepID=UPI001CCF4458|nr:acetylserotonin O-methyltransferase [Hyalangium versicolor]